MKKLDIVLLLLIVTMVFSTAIRAQSNLFNYITCINNQIANVPVVFEGKVQSVRIFAGDQYGNPLTSSDVVWNGEVGYWQMANGKQGFGYSEAFIKVCKTYKGDVPLGENGLFRVLTKAYSLHNIYIMKQDNGTGGKEKYTYVPSKHPRNGANKEQVILPADAYSKQLYICKKVDQIIPANYAAEDYYYSNFETLYEMAFDAPVTIPQPGGNGIKTTAYCTLFDYIFSGPDELEVFLSQIDGVNPRPEEFCRGEQRIDNIKPVRSLTSQIDYSNNIKNYNVQMELLKQKISINAVHSANKTSSVFDLNLNMANERILESGGDNWFEFDITASTNQPNTFFDNCLMRIQYNTVAFGTNAMSAGNVFITRASSYNSSTYTNPQTQAIDQTNNTLGIPFGTDFSAPSWTRVLLTTTPVKMLTVRMKITFCGQSANLTFVDQATCSIFSFFAATATANIVNTVSFDNTNYTGSITDNVCQPIITGFTNNVPAGIGRHLIITGKYFGPSMGDGTVIFKDADWGTVYPPINFGAHNCGVQPYDIVSWTDNKIIIKLPSIIDSAKTWDKVGNVLVPASGIARVFPGSGKFIVQNFTLSRKETTTPLNIPFSLANVIAPNTSVPTGLYRKKPVRIVGPNSSVTGYNIQFNPNVATFNANIKPVFYRAMKNWSCVTGINWKVGTDVSGGAVLNDLIHEVMIAPVNGPGALNPGVLMQTNNGIAVCVNNGVETWYKKTFDILINPNANWAYDTTGAALATGDYDFFHCAMHELGHAHTLYHINDSLHDIIFWAQNPTQAVNPSRKSVYSSPNAVSGGQHVTDSLFNGVSCENNMVLFFPTQCNGAPVTGIKKVNGQLVDLSVYPNPSDVNQSINVHFKLPSEQKVGFKLCGITGNLIRNVVPEDFMGEVDYVLDAGNLVEGMYLLTVSVGGKEESFKIIKQ